MFCSNCETWCRTTDFVLYHVEVGGRGSIVGIATDYGLEGPGIESQWGTRFFAPVQTGTGTHPASCTMGTGSFPGVKNGRCVTLTPHPLLVPWSWKSRTIPLLPLWAVRPVQSLSACTGVELYFYSPYGPYGLYRASVPVQGGTLCWGWGEASWFADAWFFCWYLMSVWVRHWFVVFLKHCVIWSKNILNNNDLRRNILQLLLNSCSDSDHSVSS